MLRSAIFLSYLLLKVLGAQLSLIPIQSSVGNPEGQVKARHDRVLYPRGDHGTSPRQARNTVSKLPSNEDLILNTFRTLSSPRIFTRTRSSSPGNRAAQSSPKHGLPALGDTLESSIKRNDVSQPIKLQSSTDRTSPAAAEEAARPVRNTRTSRYLSDEHVSTSERKDNPRTRTRQQKDRYAERRRIEYKQKKAEEESIKQARNRLYQQRRAEGTSIRETEKGAVGRRNYQVEYAARKQKEAEDEDSDWARKELQTQRRRDSWLESMSDMPEQRGGLANEPRGGRRTSDRLKNRPKPTAIEEDKSSASTSSHDFQGARSPLSRLGLRRTRQQGRETTPKLKSLSQNSSSPPHHPVPPQLLNEQIPRLRSPAQESARNRHERSVSPLPRDPSSPALWKMLEVGENHPGLLVPLPLNSSPTESEKDRSALLQQYWQWRNSPP